MKLFMALALVVLGVAAGQAQAETVLVTGANRGLGLEFTRQYAARGYTVIATARNPAKSVELTAFAAKHKNVMVEQLDVLDPASIAAVAAKYKGKPIDILLNNAGVLGDGPGQTFGTVNLDTFNSVMDTNLFGTLLVTQAFVDNVAASNLKKIIAVTSPAGSFNARPPVKLEPGKESLPPVRAASPGMNGNMFYSASKVALNLTMYRLGRTLRPRGVIVGLIAPYTVETEMLAETGYARPATSLSDGVAGLIKDIDGITKDSNGKPIGDDGYLMDW